MDEKVKTKLEKVSNKFGVSLDEVEKIYNEVLSTLPESGNKEKLALNKTVNKLRRERMARRTAVDFEGVILGVSELRNVIEEMKRIAEGFSKKDLQAAIKRGMVDPDGTPIDWRPYVRGRPNPNHGQPLSGYEYVRDILGALKRGGAWMPFWLTMYGEKASEEGPKPNGLYSFKALEGNVVNGVLRLDSSEHTEFTAKEGAVPDVRDILSNQKVLVPIYQLPEHTKARRNQRYTFVEGVIYRIREPRGENGRFSVDLVDVEEPDISLRCRLYPWVPLTVDEDSTVVATGRLWSSGDRFYMETIGIYPIPELSIPRVIG